MDLEDIKWRSKKRAKCKFAIGSKEELSRQRGLKAQESCGGAETNLCAELKENGGLF